MENLFAFLILASLVCLIVGLIRPSVFSRFIKKGLTRKKIGLVFGGAFIVSFILFGITAEPIEKEMTTQENLTDTELQDETPPLEEAVEKEETQPEPQPENTDVIEATEPITKETTEPAQPEPEVTPEPTIEPTLEPETASNEETTNEATLGEKNALNKALSYLSYSPFSYSGLVTQLEYEGYTNKEAIYGADNSGADWNEQAKLKAEKYLDYSAYSRDGLITQLEYEGFTRQQAEYGVQAVGY
jgi:colicin import membrane protein